MTINMIIIEVVFEFVIVVHIFFTKLVKSTQMNSFLKHSCSGVIIEEDGCAI